MKTRHLAEFVATPQKIDWLEIHSENYLSPGGPHLVALERIRRDYPLSCHGVGLSLGSAAGLDPAHLERLRRLYARLAPAAISEHLSWSVDNGIYLNDLLPVPYTEEALGVFARNVQQAQDLFGRRLLIENPSSYVRYVASSLGEAEFLAELVRRTGCGLLLDVNNIHVSARNQGFDAAAYLAAVPGDAVAEIHVAGHSVESCDGEDILIDDHGSVVRAEVWDLLAAALARFGPRPVLVEWDTRVPELSVLLGEAHRAQLVIESRQAEWSAGRAA